MKRWAIFIFLALLLGTPVGLNASEDPFDTGRSSMSGTEALFSMGIWALTHPESVKGALDGPKQEPKKKEDLVVDKKVDEAIKKAWEEKNQ